MLGMLGRHGRILGASGASRPLGLRADEMVLDDGLLPVAPEREAMVGQVHQVRIAAIWW